MTVTANTLCGLIERRAREQPERPFLIAPDDDRRLSYGELWRQVDALNHHLDACCPPGGKIALLLDNGYWSTLLLLAIMAGGRVAVALNASAGSDQLNYALDHCDAELLLVSDGYRDKAAELHVERSLQRVAVGPHGPHWQATARPTAARPRSAGPQPHDPALLLYTSGTTGTPKGALLSHRNLLAGGANVTESHALTQDDRALCVLPLYHINGLVVTVIAPLVSGGSVVMPRRFSAGRFWGWLAEHRCTWFSAVPTIISYLLDRAEREPYRFGAAPELARLRFGRSASAPLPEAAFAGFERTFKLPLIETMGLTETAAPILSNPLPPAARKIGSPGIPFGNEIKVVDPANPDRELPIGKPGELLIRGPNVLAGYYKNPAASAAALHAGWLRSGDLGYRDADGYFFITGRLKELIIKGGENIAPREIDEALYRHPAVLEAAAVGLPDPHYGQTVAAGVVLRQGQRCSEQELIRFCAERVGEFRAPSRVVFRDALPQGPSGKVQRLKLAELLSKQPS